jgi:RNA polymerase sigma factor (sigma-70 family)
LTLLAAARGDDGERRRAHEALVAAYWKPVYKLLRLRWGASPEEAEDSTQDFFLAGLERDLFARYDPARARFRTYLRTCLDGFAANRRQAARRAKRGGGATIVPLDFAGAEAELAGVEPVDGEDGEAVFHREWVRHLFARALERTRRRLAARGQAAAWELFERLDLAGTDAPRRPSYDDLAADLGIPATQVTNRLGAARRELRRAVLELLAEATGSERELAEEARALLGVTP